MKKTLLLLALLMPALASGQNAPPNKEVRVIPLGQLPQWVQAGIKEGIRDPQPLVPGSMPPANLSAPNGKGDIQTAALNLNTISGAMMFGPKVAKLDFHEGELAAGAPWLASPMPASAKSIVLLYRDHKLMSWNNPKMLLLDDGKDVFPAGTIRFVNVSDLPVVVEVGKSGLKRVAPQKSLILPLNPGVNTLMVGYSDQGEKVFAFPKNTINAPGNQRVQAFIYKAQDKRAKKKVLFHWTPELP